LNRELQIRNALLTP